MRKTGPGARKGPPPGALVLVRARAPRSAGKGGKRALFCAPFLGGGDPAGKKGGTTHDDEMDQSVCSGAEHGCKTVRHPGCGEAAACTEARLLEKAGDRRRRPDPGQAEAAREQYGPNQLVRPKRKSSARRLLEAFCGPPSPLVLLLLAVVSVFTDILFAAPGPAQLYDGGHHHGDGGGVGGAALCAGDPAAGNVAEKLTP